MHESRNVPFAELTTLRVGGPARVLVDCRSNDEIAKALTAAGPVLVVGGGSNLLVADAGFDGVAVRVGTSGVGFDGDLVTVAAGEPWDDFVALCVSEGFAGVECLSGIPGSTGATPIQNVGAYGQDVAQTIETVRALDRSTGQVRELTPAECAFGYRSSSLRGTDRWIVLAVTFRLERARESRPLAYAQLAAALDVELGTRAPLADVREAVLALRRSKGMVLDDGDPDSHSAGSFFVNPILRPDQLDRPGLGEAPRWPGEDGLVKTSAAWLIERAGFTRGYGDGRAGISSKHTLAIVNRGGATAADVLALAREIRDGVREAFGVELRPEPTLIGVEL